MIVVIGANRSSRRSMYCHMINKAAELMRVVYKNMLLIEWNVV